jgi:hypothetical protein
MNNTTPTPTPVVNGDHLRLPQLAPKSTSDREVNLAKVTTFPLELLPALPITDPNVIKIMNMFVQLSGELRDLKNASGDIKYFCENLDLRLSAVERLVVSELWLLFMGIAN